jgi:hypothetical protein
VPYGSPMVTDTKDDIRPALRERLQAIEAELADLPRRQKKLEALRDSLKALLEREDALRDSVDESLVPAFHPTDDHRTLADLILRVLGTGPRTLEQLKEIGASWPHVRDSQFPGRALNFALVGLQKGGYVERLDNGAWKLVPEKSGNEARQPLLRRGIRRP